MRAPLTILLLCLLLLAPSAAADHTYSHRYVVFGKLVDIEGRPVSDTEVKLGYDGFEVEGVCSNQPGSATDAFGPTAHRPVTNAFGEFVLCMHTHFLEGGAIRLAVPSLGIQQDYGLDTDTRVTHALLAASEPVDAAGAAHANVTILGRAWREGNATVESIPSTGVTLDQVPVHVRVAYADGTAESLNTTTNQYGDYAVRLPGSDGPVDVTVEVNGTTFHASHIASDWIVLNPRFDTAGQPVTPPTPTPGGGGAPGTPSGGPDAAPTPDMTAPAPPTPEPGAPVPLPGVLVLAALVLGALATRRE